MRTLSIAGTVILLASGTPAFAADDMQAAEADEVQTVAGETESDELILEEVVVHGIRSSLRDAVDIKRSNVGVMEAISAEDFGKFPDGNLAESLARVPGVAIDRSNVEGQKIAVRGFGPEFNLVTLNGRQMPTAPGVWGGGRSFNFGDIASPGVTSVEVFKAADSTMPSGGIGATVNMVTTKPLNVDGTKTYFGLALVEDSTSVEDDYPIEATMLFATNQDRWGFSISGAYQERTNREEGTRESNWLVPEVMQQTEGYLRVDSSNPAYTNNNTRADGYTFYQEPSAYQIKDNDRTRLNTQATFQYAFTDNLIATVDYTYSSVDFSAVGVMFGSWLGGWDTDNAVINEHGAYTDVVVSNRAYDHELIWQTLENTNKSLGLNVDWQITDSFNLAFDAHSSSAAVDGGELDNSIGFTTDNKAIITHINGGNSGIQTFSYDAVFNPENYMGTNLTLRDGYKENDMSQYRLDGEWANMDGGFLSSIQFGISRVDSEFSKVRNIGSFPALSPQAGDWDDDLFQRTNLGNFMNSFNPDIGTDYYYTIDPTDALAAFIAINPDAIDPVDGTPCCSPGPIDDNERVNETLDSVYLQFNMETDIKGMPLSIVAGARYEMTDVEAISYYARPNKLRWDMIAGMIAIDDGTGAVDSPRYGDSDILLPNLAMSLGVTDNQVVRFSVGKSMARPDLFDMSSQITFGTKDYFQVTAEGGNPDLDPLESTNFDISYENYYAPGSYFAINYFYKDIKGFVGTRTETGVTFEGLTDPSQSLIGQEAINCVRAWVDAGRPQTGFPGEEGATGDCVSQQALWAQGWMNDFQHMGWVVNALAAGVDLSNGYPWSPPECAGNGADGWWRCDPGYLDGTSADPLALIEYTAPYNMNKGSINGLEFSFQHLFERYPFGVTFNYTYISGGDVDIKRDYIGEQFILPGLGDAGNLSVFFENEKHTFRVALNHRGETVAGFGNYDQPLYVEERNQWDASYQYRFTMGRALTTLYLEVSNFTDEPTRLYARYPEMLFLSQDHGPIYKLGFRTNF
ncbi:MAG: TonB-dependent receptor [Xanthomonadales bacterium]|jgi:TonB-dependent receptor|nr:TonB-dependent receptor [Xanthomonadales bacterium]